MGMSNASWSVNAKGYKSPIQHLMLSHDNLFPKKQRSFDEQNDKGQPYTQIDIKRRENMAPTRQVMIGFTFFDDIKTMKPGSCVTHQGKDGYCGLINKNVIYDCRIVHNEWHCVAWHDDNLYEKTDSRSEHDRASN
jgi:hypothetical protein